MTAAPTIPLMLIGFLIVIGPLIFLHEMGHYLVGRWFGVKADAFSIGMGRELAGWTDRRGTRWKLSLLPIGGYVKFAGDMGPASTPDPAWLRLPPEERARTFQAKPVWQRFLIVLAGPVTNLLIAVAIFAGFFMAYGIPETPATVAAVLPGSAAERAGILAGDRIVGIAGRRVGRFEDLRNLVSLRPGERMVVHVQRRGRVIDLTATPTRATTVDPAGNRMDYGVLGVSPGTPVSSRVGPVRAMTAGVAATGGTIRTMIDVIGQILFGQRSVKELGGPLKIAQFSGATVAMGPLPVIEFMALISINLGFINLLPIPLLDGGHLFFYTIEAVRRRPVSARAQDLAFRSGLAVLLAFMAFVTVNDLGSFGVWRKLAGLIG